VLETRATSDDRICAGRERSLEVRDDLQGHREIRQGHEQRQPARVARVFRQTCELTLDKDHAKIWGYTGIELQGHDYEQGEFCGLHIGPLEVRDPVPPTILENFIDDPALARQIDAKLAPIDITKEYSYQERVAGFQLDVVQQGVRFGADRALFVDLRMNGCDQYPDASPAVTKTGRPIVPESTLR
jgi:hypothetical protein